MKQQQLAGLWVVEDLCLQEGVGILQAEVEDDRLLKHLEGRHKVQAVQKGMAPSYTGQIALQQYGMMGNARGKTMYRGSWSNCLMCINTRRGCLSLNQHMGRRRSILTGCRWQGSTRALQWRHKSHLWREVLRMRCRSWRSCKVRWIGTGRARLRTL